MTEQLGIDFSAPRPDEPMGALALVQLEPARYRDDFAKWLLDNFAIWRAFEREANHLWNVGRSHYSARTIGEVLRHHTTLQQKDGQFKLNDHAWPDCARLYVRFHPEREHFFEFRSSRRAA